LTTFEEFVRRATGSAACPGGFAPYAYQQRLADEGHPLLLRVPTGGGKTLGATLPWLYRRRNPATRDRTPRRLVMTLPMRTLVDQTYREIHGWLARLGLGDEAEDGVGLYRLVGGAGPVDGSWRHAPDKDVILVGTLDQTLSRALNRGYGVSRYSWPIDFGLLNDDTLWVFDEIQLMGPALPTSRQLDAFRHGWGTVRPCQSMWMSATVEADDLSTVDNPNPPSGTSVVELSEADRVGPLGARLAAGRTIREISLDGDETANVRQLARVLVTRHLAGTRTLAFVNTVRRARDLAAELHGLAPSVPVVLLHSRFRPGDREKRFTDAVGPVGGAGVIVVSTQVLEAGVDVSARVLLTESAPWPSVVQRAGRSNRDGAFPADEAELLWCVWPRKPNATRSGPYPVEDLEAAERQLRRLNGTTITTADLNALEVPVRRQVHAVLRRRDLQALFDTSADLVGNDIDIGRFLREGGDLDVLVGWIDLPSGRSPGDDVHPPTSQWLCPVPVAEARALIAGDRALWRFDPLARTWARCIRPDQVRPGQVLLMSAADGCYTPDDGWDPKARGPVPVPGAADPGADAFGEIDEPADDGAATSAATGGQWISLRDHSADVEERAAAFAQGSPPTLREAVIVAGRLHDLGKAHEDGFQRMLVASTPSAVPPPDGGGPWAKSPDPSRGKNMERPYFRHELASALALLGDARAALDGVAEPDLVVYLVAAHHGRVRLAVRSMPTENGGRVLGIAPGDSLPAVDLLGGTIPAAKLDLSLLEIGEGEGGPSWTARMLTLRDRPDLGPFRLGTLEALVRLADWAASRTPGTGSQTAEAAR
jgi:CRISPR-associated endonuclease/helicase Cas3